MTASTRHPQPPASALDHQLRFASLHHPGRAIAVPCDPQGHVDLDALPRRVLESYLGARAMVGRDYACPVVSRIH